ncbi:MAG: T9SS type A sorting domain-containing protein [Saprospiraceae bacterium]|nr:T9SS type A sorting domain-containing protein [Saprospiraceae bacterium]
MKNVLGILFCALMVLIFLHENDKPEEASYIPGSFKALDLFSYVRSYPNTDIPSKGYVEGFEFHKKYYRDNSAFKSNDTWEAVGPLNTAGRTLTIAVNPQDDHTIYAGSASGGLWRSRNLGLGQSWEYVSTGFPILGVSTIEFAPGDSTTMYIGTGEVYNYANAGTDAAFRSTRGSYGVGILKSDDGGQSWSKSLDWSYNQQQGVWMIKVSQSAPNIVYAATTEGVYKSVNSGNSWIKVLDAIMCTDVEVDPDNPDKLVVGCGNFGTPGKGIYFTTDGGTSWRSATGDIPSNFNGKILLARSNSDPEKLYASIGNGFGFNDGATWLLASTDGGQSWTERNTSDYSRWQGWFSHDIAVHPTDPDKIICVGIDIWRSNDGGNKLDRMSSGGVAFGTPEIDEPDGPANYSHSDHHFVMYHPNIDSLVLFGNDGGVFLSYDNGATFRSANGGYQSTQFYNGFSVSNANPSFALGGLQDNSTVVFRGNPEWTRVIGGDGSWSAINQDDNNIVFGSYQGLSILRSTNNGLSFQPIDLTFSPGENPLFISPYLISEADPNIMYAGGVYVYKSEDTGITWETVNGNSPINNTPIFCMGMSSATTDVVYVGTVGISGIPSSLHVSLDGGNSFSEANTGLPDRIPNDIAVDPRDPAIAYVAFGGFGTQHLYKTTDYGLSWKAIDLNLPDVPGNAIAIDPMHPEIIYYGNDLGVYVTENEGDTWEAMQTGAPQAMIAMDLTISPSDRTVWLATHGNGAFRANLIEPSVSTSDNLIADDIQVYPNPADAFINIQSKLSSSIEWQLIDISGKMIKRGKGKQVEVQELESGIYILNLLSSEQKTTRRIVVQ